MLCRTEQRQLRQVARGLRAGDPDWTRRYHPRWRRVRLAALVAVDLAAVGLVVAGALTVSLPLVFAGLLLASAGCTGHVGSGRRVPHHPGRLGG